MNRFSERFQYLERLSNTNTYTINKGNLNIVFLGVCRSIYLCICFEELCKHLSYFQRAQFGLSTIAVYQMGTEMKNQNIINTVENADIIVCEQLRSYKELNTSVKCQQNIFNSFNIKQNCKIIQIPNLEYYEEKYDLTILVNQCKKYNFNKVAEYIYNNIENKKLFVTYNHPSNSLMLEFFKELCEICFNQQLPKEIIHDLNKILIF